MCVMKFWVLLLCLFQNVNHLTLERSMLYRLPSHESQLTCFLWLGFYRGITMFVRYPRQFWVSLVRLGQCTCWKREPDCALTWQLRGTLMDIFWTGKVGGDERLAQVFPTHCIIAQQVAKEQPLNRTRNCKSKISISILTYSIPVALTSVFH